MVWERIEQIRKQAELDRIQRASEIERIEQQRATQRQSEEKQKRERDEKSRRARIKILMESGALSTIRDLDRGLEGKVKKHVIIEDLDEGRLKLVWGNTFEVENKEIHGVKRKKLSSSELEADYSCITVRASDYSPYYSLEISGADGCSENFSLEKWQQDKTAVINAIAKAFLHPRTARDDIREEEIYSSQVNPFENGPRQV